MSVNAFAFSKKIIGKKAVKVSRSTAIVFAGMLVIVVLRFFVILFRVFEQESADFRDVVGVFLIL